MTSTEETTYHSVWTRQGPQTLTGDQEDIREEWKAHVAVTLLQGHLWRMSRIRLVAAGLDPVAAKETLLDAIQELIEDGGWDQYRP